jgi:hypothetical protein
VPGRNKILAEKPPTEIRKVTFSAMCALLLTCAFAIVAHAKQQAGPTSTKPASTLSGSTKKTSATSAKKTTASATHRKPVTHSSSGKSTSSTRRSSAKSKGKRTSTKRVRGQQKIDSERAQSIQEALIREHYLSGEPTGTWNQASEDAMRKYQADHGWQSKQVPDSRALIKLGLGPSKDHLLNPESAMTTVPDAPRAEPLSPASHSADPGQPALPQTKSSESSDPR